MVTVSRLLLEDGRKVRSCNVTLTSAIKYYSPEALGCIDGILLGIDLSYVYHSLSHLFSLFLTSPLIQDEVPWFVLFANDIVLDFLLLR